MFTFSLQNIFGTFSVGLLAITLVGSLRWLLADTTSSLWVWLPRHIMFRDGDGGGGGLAGLPLLVLLVLAYALGNVAQMVTDELSDSGKHYSWYDWRHWQVLCLRSEDELRLSTLLKSSACTPSGYELRTLGRDFFASDKTAHLLDLAESFQHSGFEAGEKALFVRAPGDYLSTRRLTEERRSALLGLVNSYYYHAKNWAYGQTNLFAELDELQRKNDFLRSCFLVASWALLALSGVTIMLLKRGSLHVLWRRVVVVGAACMVICFLTAMGYRHGEDMFDERVFGYYASHVSRQVHPVQPAEAAEADPALLGGLWMQTSAEYAAICRQTFEAAKLQIVRAQASYTGSGQDIVIMDLDETLLDNSGFQGHLARTKQPYSAALWRQWVEEYPGEVRLLPGGEEFLKFISSSATRQSWALRYADFFTVSDLNRSDKDQSGDVDQVSVRQQPRDPRWRALDRPIHVKFISNRKSEDEVGTIRTLEAVGVFDALPAIQHQPDWLQLAEDSTSKQSRLAKFTGESASTQWHVLATLGDNLNDFGAEFERETIQAAFRDAGERPSLDVVRFRRRQLVDGRFGTAWFVMPNPVYGSWDTDFLPSTHRAALLSDPISE